MQNKKLLVLLALGIVAIFSLFHGITAVTKVRTNIPSRGDTVRGVAAIQQNKTIISPTRRAKRTTFASWGKDPFSPSGVYYSTTGLSGIIWDTKSPKALVGERVVGIGDRVNGNTVVKIEKDRIIVNDGTKDFELKLGQ